jgi:hypothetical protein
MLMITRSVRNDLTRTLRLEGKLLGPWIGELEVACGRPHYPPNQICLDLGGLTFLDAEGARCLKGLIRNGTRVIACSGFVAEMLQQEQP